MPLSLGEASPTLPPAPNIFILSCPLTLTIAGTKGKRDSSAAARRPPCRDPRRALGCPSFPGTIPGHTLSEGILRTVGWWAPKRTGYLGSRSGRGHLGSLWPKQGAGTFCHKVTVCLRFPHSPFAHFPMRRQEAVETPLRGERQARGVCGAAHAPPRTEGVSRGAGLSSREPTIQPRKAAAPTPGGLPAAQPARPLTCPSPSVLVPSTPREPATFQSAPRVPDGGRSERCSHSKAVQIPGIRK